MSKKSVFSGAFAVTILGLLALALVYAPTPDATAQLPPNGYSYATKFVCGPEPQLNPDSPWLTEGIYRTEINIYNYQPDAETNIEKYILLLVDECDPVGREPNRVPVTANDFIILPPMEATMDDCERIAQLLGKPWPLNGVLVGYLDVVSMSPVKVTAVYTSRRSEQGGTSIDVEQIQGEVRCPEA
jgi:hypothetical protein